MKLTHAVEGLLDQGVTQVTVLDLGELAEANHTGIAVLVAVGRDLKAAGSQVRVVAADRALLGRLPYTLGLRRTFASLPGSALVPGVSKLRLRPALVGENRVAARVRRLPGEEPRRADRRSTRL